MNREIDLKWPLQGKVIDFRDGTELCLCDSCGCGNDQCDTCRKIVECHNAAIDALVKE